MMFSLFGKKQYPKLWKIDMHSHLLPGVDDGAKTIEESIEMIRSLVSFGVEKIITTPHIYPEVYPNTEQELNQVYEKVKASIASSGIKVEFELGAEYFIHEELLSKLEKKLPLLSFGSKRYVLIETSFQSLPPIFDHVIFELKVQGYQPVLAHPERYAFVANNINQVRNWQDQGILMQMNMPSLLGKYGAEVKAVSKKLLQMKSIDMIGTDMHRRHQLAVLQESSSSKLFYQASLLAGSFDPK